MNVTLPLERMTTADKLRTMESLWDNLCRAPESIVSPSWHGQVLRDREEAVRQGDENFSDWEDAKREIRETVS